MKRVIMASSLLALTAGAAYAGGIERTTQSTAILFKDGNYAELSFGTFSPEISGTVASPIGALSSGDMALGYGTLTLGYKRALTDKLDMALQARRYATADPPRSLEEFVTSALEEISEPQLALLAGRASAKSDEPVPD